MSTERGSARRFCLGRSDEQNEVRGERPVCVGIDANRPFAPAVFAGGLFKMSATVWDGKVKYTKRFQDGIWGVNMKKARRPRCKNSTADVSFSVFIGNPKKCTFSDCLLYVILCDSVARKTPKIKPFFSRMILPFIYPKRYTITDSAELGGEDMAVSLFAHNRAAYE
ncbi:MAG: hypothetical protein NC319_06455, partial [Butyricicoccus sp.]|nr:hypothetical protein [Butyricicoccus sp.]